MREKNDGTLWEDRTNWADNYGCSGSIDVYIIAFGSIAIVFSAGRMLGVGACGSKDSCIVAASVCSSNGVSVVLGVSANERSNAGRSLGGLSMDAVVIGCFCTSSSTSSVIAFKLR